MTRSTVKPLDYVHFLARKVTVFAILCVVFRLLPVTLGPTLIMGVLVVVLIAADALMSRHYVRAHVLVDDEDIAKGVVTLIECILFVFRLMVLLYWFFLTVAHAVDGGKWAALGLFCAYAAIAPVVWYRR